MGKKTIKKVEHEVIEETTPKDSRAGKPFITAAQWAEIEELYASGEWTSEQLGSKYDIGPAYLRTKMKEVGVTKGMAREKIRSEVREAIEGESKARAKLVMERAAETKDEHYRYAKTLSQVLYMTLAQTIKAKGSIAKHKDEVAVLKSALQALEVGRNTRYEVLGLNEDVHADTEIPTLVVEEMSDADALRQKREMDRELGVDLEEVSALAEKIGSFGGEDEDGDPQEEWDEHG